MMHSEQYYWHASEVTALTPPSHIHTCLVRAPCSAPRMLEQGELEQLQLAPAGGSRGLMVAGAVFEMEFEEPALAVGARVNDFYPGVTFENAVKVLTPGTGNGTRTVSATPAAPTQ
jgi:hypothetical protein